MLAGFIEQKVIRLRFFKGINFFFCSSYSLLLLLLLLSAHQTTTFSFLYYNSAP
jgi:hypothetical protein